MFFSGRKRDQVPQPGGCRGDGRKKNADPAWLIWGSVFLALAYASSDGRLRSRLRVASRRLAWRRRSRDAFVGRVARRDLGTASARARRSVKRLRASSRLRVCERSSWAIATTRWPTRVITRRRCDSLSEGEASTSKLASTREAVTLACWPPGPEERLTRTRISAWGIVRSRFTRSRFSEASSGSGGGVGAVGIGFDLAQGRLGSGGVRAVGIGFGLAQGRPRDALGCASEGGAVAVLTSAARRRDRE